MLTNLQKTIESLRTLSVADDGELLRRYNQVCTQLINDPSLPGPLVDINRLEAVLTGYAAAVSAMNRGRFGAQLERDRCRDEVMRIIRIIANQLPDPEQFADTGGALLSEPPSDFPLQPPPLQSSDSDGKPYSRPAHVESELCRILSSERSVCSARPRELQCESLICLIRLTGEENPILSGKLLQELRKRIRHRGKKFCRSMDQYDREQFVLDLDSQILELVLTKEPSRQRCFLEVRFGLELKRLADKLKSKFENSTAGNIVEYSADRSHVADLEDDEEVQRPIEFLPDVRPRPEDSLLNLDLRQRRHRLLGKALRAVTDRRAREAVILHHARGIPITSCKRGQKCLTRHFHKKASDIRGWLDTAMKEMREAVGVTVNGKRTGKNLRDCHLLEP